MKKAYYILALILATLILTGCGEKKVTCSSIQDNKTSIYSIYTKNEIITKVVATETYVVDNNAAELNKSVYDLTFIQYNAVAGVNAESSIMDNNKVSYTIIIDKEKLDKDAYTELYNTTVAKTILTPDIVNDITKDDYIRVNLPSYNCE